MKGRYGFVAFLVLVFIIGLVVYAQASNVPQDRCRDTSLYASAPRANVELYPNDIVVIHPDGSKEYVPPLHQVLVLTNPIKDYQGLVTAYEYESSSFPVSPIYYGTVKTMASGTTYTALWYLDRDLTNIFPCYGSS